MLPGFDHLNGHFIICNAKVTTLTQHILIPAGISDINGSDFSAYLSISQHISGRERVCVSAGVRPCHAASGWC